MNRKFAAYLLGILLTFWAGAVLSISFMEAPLKFTAPGISIPLGVGIGRVVFHALQKLEWSLSLLSLALMLRYWPPMRVRLPLAGVAVILLVQAVWLLPALDARAEQLLSQPARTLAPSQLHISFVLVEGIKLVLLLFSSIQIGLSLPHATRS